MKKKNNKNKSNDFNVNDFLKSLEPLKQNFMEERQRMQQMNNAEELEQFPDEWISILPDFMQCRVGDLAGEASERFRVSVSPDIADKIHQHTEYRFITDNTETTYYVHLDPENIQDAVCKVADLWLSDAESSDYYDDECLSYIVYDVAVNVGTGEITITLDY